MKTLAEIKDQVAQEAGYKNWKDAGQELWPFSDEWNDNVTRRYALAVTTQDRKDCASRALMQLPSTPGLFPKISQIIHDRPLPELK